MSFLAPFYILGILAVTGPILFHLLRKCPNGRMQFSTTLFLDPSVPRVTRRSSLENWPLLILRGLALCLLALAFARPFLREEENRLESKTAGRQTVILLDVSASMQREGLWEQSVNLIRERYELLQPEEQLAILTFDQNVNPLVSFEEWNALPSSERIGLVEKRLQGLKPGFGSTSPGKALVHAIDLMQTQAAKSAVSEQELFLISDLQSSSRLEELQTFAWPEDIVLTVCPVTTPRTTNAGLQLAGMVSVRDEQRVRVRITNSPDAEHADFVLHWEDGTEFVNAHVPPGQTRILSAPSQPEHSSRLVLKGDDHAFDNTMAVAPLHQQAVTVLYYGENKPEDVEQPLYFLNKAFIDTPQRTIQLLVQDETAPPLAAVAPVRLAVVAQQLSAAHTSALRRYVELGGTLLFAADRLESYRFLNELLDNETIQVEEAVVSEYSLIEQVNFNHALLAPFAAAQYADFSKISLWKHRHITWPEQIPHQVLITSENGSPLLTEIPQGKGRVFVLACSWTPQESQLALSSKFAPLLNGLLDLSTGEPVSEERYLVGQPIPLPKSSGHRIRLPDESRIELASHEVGFEDTTQPGLYQVETDGVSTLPRLFSVNLDPAESQTDPLSIEQLESLGVKMSNPVAKRTAEERERQLLARELEQEQQIWRILILVCLGVLFVETVVARKSLKRRTESPT